MQQVGRQAAGGVGVADSWGVFQVGLQLLLQPADVLEELGVEMHSADPGPQVGRDFRRGCVPGAIQHAAGVGADGEAQPQECNVGIAPLREPAAVGHGFVGGVYFFRRADAEAHIAGHFQLVLEIVEPRIAAQVIHAAAHAPRRFEIVPGLGPGAGHLLLLAGAEQEGKQKVSGVQFHLVSVGQGIGKEEAQKLLQVFVLESLGLFQGVHMGGEAFPFRRAERLKQVPPQCTV